MDRGRRDPQVVEQEAESLSRLLLDYINVSRGNLGSPDVRRGIRRLVRLIVSDTDTLAELQVRPLNISERFCLIRIVMLSYDRLLFYQ